MTKVASCLPPSLEDFEAITEATWARTPPEIKRLAGDVTIRIEDIADDETLDLLHIDDAYDLTGLYHGVDLLHRSHHAAGELSPIVFLYRRPILEEWIARGDVPLGELINHVLVHEIGHHFGLSDEAMDAILGSDD